MSDRFDHTFDTRLVTKAGEGCVQPLSALGSARRIELGTKDGGSVRRRDWSEDDKARVVVESLAPGANISAVARRHGMKPQQLFGWRRAARELFRDTAIARPQTKAPIRPETAAKAAPPIPTFAPVVIAPLSVVPPSSVPEPATPSSLPTPSRSAVVEDRGPDGVIEIAVGGNVVRVGRGADAETLAMVLAAVGRASR